MRRGSHPVAAAIAGVLALAAAVLFWLSGPDPLPADAIPAGHAADVAAGEVLYYAGSCLACHRPPDGADDPSLPSGGRAFPTPVGTFYPQNITPDPETGIGQWTELDFVNAMARGLAPDGHHYFPAFPYDSFRSMAVTDLLDLRAYLMTLTPVRATAPPHDLPLLVVAQRGAGLWKRLAFRRPPFSPLTDGSPSLRRGAYLVNGPGHCGECHTPRNWLMLPDQSRFLQGGPHPAGDGEVPSLHGLSHEDDYASVGSLTLALQNGEELGFENLSSGGMAQIQLSLGRLPEDEAHAIAEYLFSLD